jgi:hypothetical protein
VTASVPDPKLPLWRLIGGLAVLGTLVALLILAGLVYLDDFRLDRYMRDLAEQPGLSDAALTIEILNRAQQLALPLSPGDIEITHPAGKPHIRIEKFTVQTNVVKLDLRLPAAESR